MSPFGSAALTFASGAMLLLLGTLVSIAAGAVGAVLIGPKDNKAMSVLLGGVLTTAATLPGLVIGVAVGLLR
jgi:hypothetical protein